MAWEKDLERWVEVRLIDPLQPRPIQLAVKHGDQWTPLTYREVRLFSNA